MLQEDEGIIEAAAAASPVAAPDAKAAPPDVKVEPAAASEPQAFSIGSPGTSAALPDTSIAPPPGVARGAEDTAAWFEDHPEAGTGAAASASPSAPGTAAAQGGSPGGMQKLLGEAFPADKLSNGVAAAKNFWSWGLTKAVDVASKAGDAAAKVTEEVVKSDFAKEAERLAQRTNERISTVSDDVGRKLGELNQDVLKPRFSQTVSTVGESTEMAKERAAELWEKGKPKLSEAGTTARTSFLGAVSSAAKTAIWFQSLGSGDHDDSEEEGDFSSAPPDTNHPVAEAGGARQKAPEVESMATVPPAAESVAVPAPVPASTPPIAKGGYVAAQAPAATVPKAAAPGAAAPTEPSVDASAAAAAVAPAAAPAAASTAAAPAATPTATPPSAVLPVPSETLSQTVDSAQEQGDAEVAVMAEALKEVVVGTDEAEMAAAAITGVGSTEISKT